MNGISLNLVALICDYVDGAGNPVAEGKITFAPNATVLDSSGHQVITRHPVTVSLFKSPAPQVQLIACDNPGLQPPGWGWEIQPLFPGAPPGGDPQPYTSFYTTTFVNRDGVWKAVALHTSRAR